jgi:hypothetical protein
MIPEANGKLFSAECFFSYFVSTLLGSGVTEIDVNLEKEVTTTGVVDTRGKFAAGVNCTFCQFAACVIDMAMHLELRIRSSIFDKN